MAPQPSNNTNEYDERQEHQAECWCKDGEVHPLEDISDYLRTYAKQNPDTTALICLGVGFLLGWKLKPW